MSIAGGTTYVDTLNVGQGFYGQIDRSNGDGNIERIYIGRRTSAQCHAPGQRRQTRHHQVGL